ncbi:MAG: hypothetical protein COZ20_05355 [Gallionellales bacterium CG_4_10_14_3_um_filter_54_96]|nr:MAG: hypothetical protein COZ77_08185 [Gallionellales bacterium CG_4_8_14_3_um_filter_54_18]PIY04545.1 MAG: hypothetical protein COZ20_05355 [Gallionellales bacterium CG_4_10_14_3_um_filter_54_96]
MKNPCAQFTVIDGGKEELECKKHSLFNQPWVFSFDEFEQLCEQFDVPRAEAFDLQLKCIQHKAKTNSEAAAVFAVMSGTKKASDAIAQLRRNRFRLETSLPLSLPQSSQPNDEADV